MNHPNAIYFTIAANAWISLMGVLFLLGAIGIGPYGKRIELPKGIEQPKILESRGLKVFLGLPSLLLGLIGTIGHLLQLAMR